MNEPVMCVDCGENMSVGQEIGRFDQDWLKRCRECDLKAKRARVFMEKRADDLIQKLKVAKESGDYERIDYLSRAEERYSQGLESRQPAVSVE